MPGSMRTLWAVAVLGAAAGACSAVPRAEAPPGARGPDADSGAVLDVMTLNIWHDREDWPARMEALLDGIREADPDVICLQEVLQNETLPNQAETLAGALGYAVHFASADSVGSAKRYGNAILSRTPVLARDHRLLDPLDDYRVVAHARIAPAGDTMDIYCTHLHHTQEAAGVETRRAQVLDLLDFVDATRGDGPILLAGDFNAAADADELAPVRDRFGDGYGTVHGDSAGDVTTLNTALGHRLARIDHVFFRDGTILDIVPVAAEVVLDTPTAAGIWPSDHFGVQVRFRVRDARAGMRR
jgi:endonuclease/exonuclease/phosphatase family metal-dependent hydrolase